MQIVIDIPEEEYQEIIDDAKHSPRNLSNYEWLIAKGTPLEEVFEDIKGEIEKQIKRDFLYAENEQHFVPCHYGTANGLQVAMRIIDSHISGKAESEV